MNELKAITIYDAYWKANSVGEGTGIFVYPKSEADKYIAMLKDKANYNEEAYKLKSEELADTCKLYEKELRHYKYKRCLWTARWCELKSKINNEFAADASECMPSYEARFRRKSVLYQKWAMHWMELAERFNDKEKQDDDTLSGSSETE